MTKKSKPVKVKLKIHPVRRDDSLRDKARNPIDASTEDALFELNQLTNALSRLQSDIADRKNQLLCLLKMSREVKNDGAWIEPELDFLVDGHWYILRRTQYEAKLKKHVPYSPLLMAKWSSKDGWVGQIPHGTGLVVFVPNLAKITKVNRSSSAPA